MWFCWLIFACQSEHKHEDLENQIQVLEKRLAQAEKDIHVLKSAQVRSKKDRTLCTKEKEGHFAIERGNLKAMLESKELPKALPHQEGGRMTGIRLSSLPVQWTDCGLEDGDVIYSIQDMLIRNPKMLQVVYDQHIHANEIRILRQRANLKENIIIRIIDAKKKSPRK